MRQFDLPGRSPVYAPNAVAATSHPLATTTAINILKDGGNAVDAAIAASATLAVVEPQMTGIGGDCFVLLCEPDGKTYGLNGSGRAPMHLPDELTETGSAGRIEGTSVHAVTAPGAIRAWEVLHERFGAMDFTRLFADAVGYCREGYPVHHRVAHDWREQIAKLRRNENARRLFLIDDEAPSVGSVMRNEPLATVLEAIAKGGADAFYLGDAATDIADTVAALGGYLDEADLAGVQVDWTDPMSVSFQGHTILELPPNGQGIIALILLRLVERAGIADDPGGGERYHNQIELGRLAYGAARHFLADPDYMTIDPARLLADPYVDRLISGFDREKRSETQIPPHIGDDTVYLSIVDRDLRCVSMINSIYSKFGSGIVTGKTGIVLHNRGTGFSLEDGHPNRIAAGKRPAHTIIPAMAFRDGVVSHCFGVMGGAYQPMGHCHVLSNLLCYRADPQSAVDDGRIFWNEAGILEAEAGISASARTYLTDRGHRIVDGGPHGGGQVVAIDHANGVLAAGSDPRKDGHAAGY